jgi:hypothetical protein
MAQRIKGQEVRVVMVAPSGTVTALSDVQNFEMEPMTEILSEGYLGETTERKDDIFKGARGKMDVHMETQDYFRFAQEVIDRSQRRTPAAARFNVIATLAFPNGERPRVLLEDIFFGPLPTNVGARDEYVSASVDFECSNIRYLF